MRKPPALNEERNSLDSYFLGTTASAAVPAPHYPISCLQNQYR